MSKYQDKPSMMKNLGAIALAIAVLITGVLVIKNVFNLGTSNSVSAEEEYVEGPVVEILELKKQWQSNAEILIIQGNKLIGLTDEVRDIADPEMIEGSDLVIEQLRDYLDDEPTVAWPVEYFTEAAELAQKFYDVMEEYIVQFQKLGASGGLEGTQSG